MKILLSILFAFYSTVMMSQSIKVAIAVNNVNVNLSVSKNYKVCKGSTFNLRATNASLTPPSGTPIFEWRNIDSLKTINTNPFNTSVIGRWVATIRYYNNTTATWISANDTVSITFHNQIPFNITTNSGTIITSTNIYTCGTRDTTFSATDGFSSYNWYKNSASNNVSSSKNLTITNTLLTQSEGTVSFFVTAIDVNGCYVSSQKNFRRDNSVTINLGPDKTDCQGKSLTISSTSTPAPGPLFSYFWSNGVSNVTSITVNTQGNYSLMILNNGSKCRFYDTLIYAQNPNPIVVINKDTTVCNETKANVSTSVLIGNGPFTYLWRTSSDLSSLNSSNNTITPSLIGINKYSIEVSDNIGCKGVDTVNITQLLPYQNPYFKVDAGTDFKLCNNATGNLSASINNILFIPNDNHSFLWSNTSEVETPSNAISNVRPSNIGITEFKVIATNSLGCQSIDSIEINQMLPITFIQNLTDSTDCAGSNIQLLGSASGGDNSNSAGYTYTWSPSSDGSISNNSYDLFIKKETIIYTLKATDQLGCTGETYFNITGYKPKIEIASSKDTIAFKNKPITLVADTDPTNYIEWFDIGANTSLGNTQTLPVLTDQSIVCFVEDQNACTNSDSVNVTYIDGDPYVIFVPNVFSPKANDSKNQSLKVFAIQILDEDFEFIVYNQWGELVYKTNSFNEANLNGWNGEVKNNDLKQASNVYTYSVHGKFYDGTSFSKVGTATLVQ